MTDKNEMFIKCACGKKLTLKRIGGQYQNSFFGKCDCGRKWLLEDLTEDLTEPSDPTEEIAKQRFKEIK